MKLLVYIAIFILAYYLISKYIFPFLVQLFIKKASEKFGNFTPPREQTEVKKEGEVSVKYVPPESKKSHYNPDESEDVDFEEIKDK